MGEKKDKRIRILKVPVDIVDRQEALSCVADFLSSNRCHSIFSVNPEKVVLCRSRADVASALEKASLLIPDGSGVVSVMKWKTNRAVGRLPGVELAEALLELAEKDQLRIFLLGASEKVSGELAQKLKEKYPNAIFVGRQNGYFDPSQESVLVDQINATEADIVFVALGSPRQELWISRMQSQLKARIAIGLGGTFDVLTGYVNRCPAWIQNLNLEWLYRLVTQPSRIRRFPRLLNFLFNAISIEGFGRLKEIMRGKSCG